MAATNVLRRLLPAWVVLCAWACASAPPPAPPAPVKPAGPPFEQKMSWILRLEDQRILRDAAPPPAPPAPPPAAARGRAPVTVAAPPPAPTPDLLSLLSDEEARIRRRAALA